MPNFYQIFSYLKYIFKAKNRQGVHSPFVYDLLDNVIYFKGSYYNYDKVNSLRTRLMRDKRKIKVVDLGAGSVKLGSERLISDIASVSVKNKKTGELIYRLCVHQKPRVTLELGTSLGITTCYIALANSNSSVYTIEGDPETLQIASENFKLLEITNITPITGNFDDILPEMLSKLNRADLVFLDGNHRKIPTLNYIRQIIPHLSEEGWMIIDDIHWSREMNEAWEEIKLNNAFSVTIDLFYFGLAFKHPGQMKEHFILKI